MGRCLKCATCLDVGRPDMGHVPSFMGRIHNFMLIDFSVQGAPADA